MLLFKIFSGDGHYMPGLLSILVLTCPHRQKQFLNFLCFILNPALLILSAVDIKKPLFSGEVGKLLSVAVEKNLAAAQAE